ncbi:MAG: Lrp/AsnC family transcriptional regulator [Candidatus Thorarchaeota archaeon]
MDNRDQQIIDLLIENPRISLTELAKNLKLSVTAISKRMKKLEQENFIQFSVLINVNKFKLTQAMLLIEVSDARTRLEIIKRFSDCPLVMNIYDVAGWDYQLLFLCASHDQVLLNNFMSYCPVRFIEGVKKVISKNIMMNEFSDRLIPLSKNKYFKTGSCGENCLEKCEMINNGCTGCPAADINLKNDSL